MGNLRELANCHSGEKVNHDDSVALDKAFGTELKRVSAENYCVGQQFPYTMCN